MIHHVNSNPPISYYFPPFKFFLCYIACNTWCMCSRKMYFIKDMIMESYKVFDLWAFIGFLSVHWRDRLDAFSFHFFIKGWFDHLWQSYSDALSFSKVYLFSFSLRRFLQVSKMNLQIIKLLISTTDKKYFLTDPGSVIFSTL